MHSSGDSWHWLVPASLRVSAGLGEHDAINALHVAHVATARIFSVFVIDRISRREFPPIGSQDRPHRGRGQFRGLSGAVRAQRPTAGWANPPYLFDPRGRAGSASPRSAPGRVTVLPGAKFASRAERSGWKSAGLPGDRRCGNCPRPAHGDRVAGFRESGGRFSEIAGVAPRAQKPPGPIFRRLRDCLPR